MTVVTACVKGLHPQKLLSCAWPSCAAGCAAPPGGNLARARLWEVVEAWVVMHVCSPLNQELFKFKPCQWENNHLWITQKHKDLLLCSRQWRGCFWDSARPVFLRELFSSVLLAVSCCLLAQSWPIAWSNAALPHKSAASVVFSYVVSNWDVFEKPGSWQWLSLISRLVVKPRMPSLLLRHRA